MSTNGPFRTVNASVRPGRVAVLIDKSDADWQNTALRVIEFYSFMWGGGYNIIVPTDGQTIDVQFWTILEAFDPDYVYYYLKSGVDFRLNDKATFELQVDQQAGQFLARFPEYTQEHARKHIIESLERSWASQFHISPRLHAELKKRLAPFYFEVT